MARRTSGALSHGRSAHHILTADRDTIVSWRHHAEVLATEIPGAKLELLKGFGHMLHHSAAAKVVAAVDELAG
jgi:pimeloyl-ACP methyl ester carboxylesterase